MQKRTYLLLAFIAVLILAAPLLLLPGGEFEGSDDLAGEEALAIRPDYQPWLDNILALPDSAESLLFALQAAVGSGFIGFYLGRVITRKQMTAEKA